MALLEGRRLQLEAKFESDSSHSVSTLESKRSQGEPAAPHLVNPLVLLEASSDHDLAPLDVVPQVAIETKAGTV